MAPWHSEGGVLARATKHLIAMRSLEGKTSVVFRKRCLICEQRLQSYLSCFARATANDRKALLPTGFFFRPNKKSPADAGLFIVFGPTGRTTRGRPSRIRGCASCLGASHGGANRGAPSNNDGPVRNDGDACAHAVELHVVGAVLQSKKDC